MQEKMMNNQPESNSTNTDADTVSLLNQQILQAEEAGNQAVLESLVADRFTSIRASGVRQDRRAYLDAVPANAHRGRTADHLPDR
jgi:hypothetical protein